VSLLSNNPRLKITLLILLLLAAAAGISWLVIVVSANMFRPPPNAVSVEGPWHITHEGKQIEGQTLPSYISGRSAEKIPEGVYEFRAVFETDSRMENPELVMPYTAGNALRVFLDGEYLGQAGDMGRGRSNIWNIALNFPVPRPLEPGKHTLTAKIYILYEGGPLLAPYIIDKKTAFHTRWLIFFSQKTMNGMLTEAYNRKIMPAIQKTVPSGYAVIACDLDDFKKLNDTYGHLIGDEALQRFSRTVLDGIRSSDYLIRTGGDEFLIVMPACTREAAEDLVRGIRKKLSDTPVEAPDEQVHIGVSMGLAMHEEGMTMNEVLHEADMLLYRNKQRRRE
jgi:diguanylate cyclase (GGDEF)-like protein